MTGFVDLHCHWIAGIDDGAPTPEEGIAMLRALRALGFDYVMATPHMRPGLFDNSRRDIEAAFAHATALAPFMSTASLTSAVPSNDVSPTSNSLGSNSSRPSNHALPRVALSSEHYFDDVVFQRILRGEGLPYPGEHAVLLEFYDMDLPQQIDRTLGKLAARGLTPVIAHPERYRAVWDRPETLEALLDGGAVALLDTAALTGKYGRLPQEMAETLLEKGCYYAACSDAHRLTDVSAVAQGMALIEARFGEAELGVLFRDGPNDILNGTISV